MEDKKPVLNSRRSFIKNVSLASAFYLTGKVGSLTAAEVYGYRSQVKLRFIVASDAHYGQPNTLYEQLMDTATKHINLFHQNNPLDFCVINGDIIHNDKQFLPQAKAKLDILTMPYYVTRGNHDMVTDAFWEQTWTTPLNHVVTLKNTTLILGDTSNEQGVYLSPNINWLDKVLAEYQHQKNIFLFLHIPQAKWTANGIDTPAVFELVKKYSNVKAVFHGHEHDQDGVKVVGKVPFLFDAHIGGNWGTAYKGFRVVEILKDNTMLTYMMNPTEKMNETRYE